MPSPALQPLTDEYLQEIERRLAACSPGPWCHRLLGFIETVGDVVQVVGVTCQRHEPHDPRLPAAENADFIAHARQDLPALLAEVIRLRERVRQLEAALVQGNGAPSPTGVLSG